MKRDLASDLLEVADDMRFGKEAGEKMELDDNVKNWMEGMFGTLTKVEKALEIMEIKSMQVEIGTKFDSALHEAIGVVDEGEDGTVHQVVQQGYLIDDIVIRPARVLVNKASKSK